MTLPVVAIHPQPTSSDEVFLRNEDKIKKILSGESEDLDIIKTKEARKKDAGELPPPIPTYKKETQKAEKTLRC